MNDGEGVVRRVVWSEIFPSVMIARSARLAFRLPILAIALVGTLLMPIGPYWFEAASPVVKASPTSAPAKVEGTGHWPTYLNTKLVSDYTTLLRPFGRVFDRRATLGQQTRQALIAGWYLLVWSICGGAITRAAVVWLGRHEQVSMSHLLRYVRRNGVWYGTSPLFPLFGLALLSLPLWLLGWVMQLDLGVFVAGLLWPLVLILGLVMGVLFTGLVFGWPLMWPTISAEQSGDSFQAFSNSYSFTFQRPLHYLGYACLAVVLGSLGTTLAQWFAEMVILLSQWGLSFGLGHERLGKLLAGGLDGSTTCRTGHAMIEFWYGVVRRVPSAFSYSFLFCAASAIYLLLRREVDQTDFDEITMPDEKESFSLPPLQNGPHGVPEMAPPPQGMSDATGGE